MTQVRPCGSKAPLYASGNEQSRRVACCVDCTSRRRAWHPDHRWTDWFGGGCQEQKAGTGEIMQLEWQLQCNLWLLSDSHPQQPLTAIHYSPANEDINIPAAGERQDAVFYLTALKEHRLHRGSACEFSIVLNMNVIVVSLNGGCIHLCDITGINVLTLIVRVDSYTHVTSDGFLRNPSWEWRLIFTKPESTERCQWLIKWLQTESPSVVKPDITISLVKPRERGQTDRRTHGEATWELRPGQGHPSLLSAAGASPEWPQ